MEKMDEIQVYVRELRLNLVQVEIYETQLRSDVKIMFAMLQTVLRQAVCVDPDEIDYAALDQAKNIYIETHDLLDLTIKTKEKVIKRLEQFTSSYH